MSVKLLTQHHLEFLSVKWGCTGSSESTLVKMSNCWKSHAAAQLLCNCDLQNTWNSYDCRRHCSCQKIKTLLKKCLNLSSVMRTGFFQKRGIPVKKRGNPFTPFKMQQIWTYWVKPETIYFSKFWSKIGNPLKKRQILIPVSYGFNSGPMAFVKTTLLTLSD